MEFDGIWRWFFPSTKALAKHLNTSALPNRRIFKPHLGLQKFSRKWFLHELTDDHKGLRPKISEEL
jgi:hypothetical protein